MGRLLTLRKRRLHSAHISKCSERIEAAQKECFCHLPSKDDLVFSFFKLQTALPPFHSSAASRTVLRLDSIALAVHAPVLCSQAEISVTAAAKLRLADLAVDVLASGGGVI